MQDSTVSIIDRRDTVEIGANIDGVLLPRSKSVPLEIVEMSYLSCPSCTPRTYQLPKGQAA